MALQSYQRPVVIKQKQRRPEWWEYLLELGVAPAVQGLTQAGSGILQKWGEQRMQEGTPAYQEGIQERRQKRLQEGEAHAGLMKRQGVADRLTRSQAEMQMGPADLGEWRGSLQGEQARMGLSGQQAGIELQKAQTKQAGYGPYRESGTARSGRRSAAGAVSGMRPLDYEPQPLTPSVPSGGGGGGARRPNYRQGTMDLRITKLAADERERAARGLDSIGKQLTGMAEQYSDLTGEKVSESVTTNIFAQQTQTKSAMNPSNKALSMLAMRAAALEKRWVAMDARAKKWGMQTRESFDRLQTGQGRAPAKPEVAAATASVNDPLDDVHANAMFQSALEATDIQSLEIKARALAQYLEAMDPDGKSPEAWIAALAARQEEISNPNSMTQQR